MAFNLGIDVDGARVVAAVGRDSSVRVVVLGRGGRAAPVAAYVADDGSVRVGDEAMARAESDPDGLVDDVTSWLGDGAEHRVNGWAVTGEVLVAHLLAYVVRRSAQAGEELGRATIAVPSNWTAARVAGLNEAAGLAGIADVDVAKAERAIERAPASVRSDPERAAAVGAAVLAAGRRPAPAAMATQAFTPAPSGSVPNPEPVTGALAAVSVFGGAFPESEPPTRDLGGVAGGGAAVPPGGAPPGGGPGDFGPSGRDRLPFYIAGGVLSALIIVLVLVLVLRGGDDDDGTATDSSTTTSSSTSTSTSSTTTSTSTTTTSTTTSTTSTTVPASTTTFTPTTLPRELGKAVLLESGVVLDYGTSSSKTLKFGDDAGETLELLRAALGGPDDDTGWQSDVEACFGSQTRRVTWGDLEIVFSELDETDGEPEVARSFEQWYVDSPGTIPPGLVSLERVGIGSLVADLKHAYPGLQISHPRSGDKTGFFTTESGDDNIISGFTTDTTDESKVTEMWAGNACQRLADSD